MENEIIFLVDDDPSVLGAVGRLLRSHDYQVQTFTSGKEFLNQSFPDGPACVVLDLQMPDTDGLEVQELLRLRRETLPVIFLSGFGDIPKSVRAMKAGAVDFLTKPVEERNLLSAVHNALVSSRAAYSRQNSCGRDRAVFETLTIREQQVCLRIVQGMLNKQVAGELGISEQTVKVHRGRVMQKLGVQSAADAVRLVERLRSNGYI